jgi:hypothetical protein
MEREHLTYEVVEGSLEETLLSRTPARVYNEICLFQFISKDTEGFGKEEKEGEQP